MISLRIIVPVEHTVAVSDDLTKCDPRCIFHVGAMLGRSENCTLDGSLVAIVDGARVALCMGAKVKP
jgi:hypothetical protein